MTKYREIPIDDSKGIEGHFKIKVGHELYAILDPEDYVWARDFSWQTKITYTSGPYAKRTCYIRINRNAKKKWEWSMHREVMARIYGQDAVKGKIVDHINGDTLDNRRKNLRITDHKGNALNTYKHRERLEEIKPREFLINFKKNTVAEFDKNLIDDEWLHVREVTQDESGEK